LDETEKDEGNLEVEISLQWVEVVRQIFSIGIVSAPRKLYLRDSGDVKDQ